MDLQKSRAWLGGLQLLASVGIVASCWWFDPKFLLILVCVSIYNWASTKLHELNFEITKADKERYDYH
jgi:hypothetical protein